MPTRSTSRRRSPRVRAAGGARIFQDAKVTAIRHDGRRVSGVQTEHGRLDADYVVLCGGMWTRDLAASIGVTVPLHACEHYYVLFQDVPGLHPDMPVLRDYDHCSYFKYDAGKLLVGAFEPNARPWGVNGIPEDFAFGEIAGDFSHFEPVLLDAMRRIPALEHAGIQKFFCGPESFTPDVRYHLGESAELANCFVAAGLNSIGLQSAGGIGKVVAEWIRDGHPPLDLWEVDVRRNMPFQINRKYLQARVSESLGLLYATHWPFRQYETARGVRKSALHDRLAGAGACFGEAFGWERANWFAPAGVEPAYAYSYGRQNWFEHSAREHRAVRSAVGLFDQSSFAKFRLEGADAQRVLNRVCANDVAVAPGKIIYTQWLNERGGIEADLTVTRLSETAYLIVTGAETESKDFNWLQRHIDPAAHCVLTNVTSGMGVLSLMGPRARELLQSLTPDDVSDRAFPFATSRIIELGLCPGARLAHHLCGRIGLGAVCPDRIHARRVRRIGQCGRSPWTRARGLPRLELAADRESLSSLGARHHRRGHAVGSGSGFCGQTRQAGRLHRTRGTAAATAIRSAQAPGAIQAQITRAPAVSQRADLAGRFDRRVRSLRHVRPFTRRSRGARLRDAAPKRRRFGRSRRRDAIGADDYEIEVAGVRYPATASLRPMYDPKNERIK